jgi:flagellar basal body-associated protein FliL
MNTTTHVIKGIFAYDTKIKASRYTFELPAGMELWNYTTSGSNNQFNITGYTTVVVDPLEDKDYTDATTSENVVLNVYTNQAPVANINCDDVVQPLVNVTITALGSDLVTQIPGSGIVNYTWTLIHEDNTTEIISYENSFEYQFANVSGTEQVLRLNLTLKDSGNLYGYTEMNVTVDMANPVPIITIKEDENITVETVNGKITKIFVNESYPIEFNGTTSTDNIGISSWEWDFGETAGLYERRKNVTTHTYQKPSRENMPYNVTLNVTDKSGRYTVSEIVQVFVKDTTKPISMPSIVEGATVRANVTVNFTADSSYDPEDGKIANYKWNFTDKEGSSIAIIEGLDKNTTTYIFTAAGTYKVFLTVKDEAGNEATANLTITVIPEPPLTANLTASKLSFSISEPTEDDKVIITLKIKNTGQAAANNVSVQFYDGSSKIGKPKKATAIPVNGEGKATVEWTAKKGTHTIKAVILEGENLVIIEKELAKDITVKESYKNVIIIVAVIAAVIGVLAVYYWWSTREPVEEDFDEDEEEEEEDEEEEEEEDEDEEETSRKRKR